MLNKIHREIIRRLALPRALSAAPLKVGARTFLTPKIDNYICDISEPWMVDLLAKLLPLKLGTFFDVGVNLGQTLLAVKANDPTRHYVGVEPNPVCVAYTEKLIALNELTDCQIIPVGLSDESGIRRLQLYDNATVDPSASLVRNFRPGDRNSSFKLVPISPFSEFDRAADLSQLALVKVDVEGGEADAVNSMREAIEQRRPWLIIEILPCYESTNIDRLRRQVSVERLLRETGYLNFRIFKKARGHFDYLQEVVEIGVHSNMDWCDYLFCPKENVDTLRSKLNLRRLHPTTEPGRSS
jgi:FkbM family methyltransferase